MKKVICLAIVVLFSLSAAAFSQSQGASTTKESKWTKTYESIARWGWKSSGDSSGSSASTKSAVKKKSTEVSPKN